MERTKLKEAREERNLKQEELADAIRCSRGSISLWERGLADPQEHYRDELCKFFGKDPSKLDLGPGIPAEKRASEIAMVQRKLQDLNLDRREVLELVGSLSVFVGVDLSMLLDAPRVMTPEDFLSQCHAGIKACWHLLKHDGLVHVDNILTTCTPRLSELATQSSDFQGIAASLVVEAKTLQALLAMHKLDFTGLEIHCAGAVRFGRMSGNGRLLAATLSGQGYVYTFHLSSTKRAISIYNEGLGLLEGNAFLNKAYLEQGLASAYALNGNEDKAIEMIKQARATMPEHPELDPLSHLIDFGLADLDRLEGRAYLALAETIHSGNYAEKAYHAFSQSTSKQATSDRSWSQTLIHQAEAALVLGDLHMFLVCLEQGLSIALQIGSQKRESEARSVLSKAPELWQKEKKYQELVKMF